MAMRDTIIQTRFHEERRMKEASSQMARAKLTVQSTQTTVRVIREQIELLRFLLNERVKSTHAPQSEPLVVNPGTFEGDVLGTIQELEKRCKVAEQQAAQVSATVHQLEGAFLASKEKVALADQLLSRSDV